MSETLVHGATGGKYSSAPATVVSSDGHVGPLLEDQLRAHCPQEWLEEFDAFATWHRSSAPPPMPVMDGAEPPNLGAAGHHDVAARLADMDRDGVAAEVLFHASLNGQPLPFVPAASGGLSNEQYTPDGPVDAVRRAEGLRIYNRWLASFVAEAPDRFIGLAYVPTWDIDAAVAEVEWAHGVGLRGVNFPAPGRRGNLAYNNPAWEPFWATCAGLGMTLTTHAGASPETSYGEGPGGVDIRLFEVGGFLSRRAAWWLTFGGVFERHPDLRLVLTEQWEGWWTSTLRDMDAIYVGGRDPLPRPPSDYLRTNVSIGASFPSASMAAEAVVDGFSDRILWGRDYPHPEGTWQHTDAPDAAEPTTKLALRHVFADIPSGPALDMVGRNAVEVYGLDGARLAAVAERIGALTQDELATPIEAVPTVHPYCRAFRGMNRAR